MTLDWMIAGAGLGFMSSFHCVGMCGPLALSLPVHHLDRNDQQIAVGLYHLGRITSYILIGAIFGVAGRQFYLAGFQQALSIVTGILIVFISLRYYIWHQTTTPKWLMKFQQLIQRKMGYWLQSKSVVAFGMLGMANGFLPCGMVYLAIASALTSQNISDSILFMMLFGVSTLPALIMLTWMGQSFDIAMRKKIRKWIPALTILVGIILIVRGLHLGIPMMSPILTSAQETSVQCH